MTARAAEGPISSYRELALYVSLSVPAILVTAIAVRLLIISTPLRDVSKPIQLIIPQLAGYIAALVLLAAMLRVQGERFGPALRWRVLRGDGAIAVAAGLGIAISSVVLGALLRTPATENPMQELMAEDPLTVGIAAVTMAPVCEELFFRGILQPLLVRDAGLAGIVLAALPFALLHGPEYAWSWRHILLITLAGSAFGAIRHRMKSTGAAAIAHATYNGMLMLLYIFGRMLI